MRSSLKGACLSGLVYPGLGQIVQKHYGRGIALVALVTGSLAVMVSAASRQIAAMLAEVESGGAAYDITTLLGEAARISGGREDAAIRWSSVVVLCCWVAGVIDAYLSGKKIDEEQAARRGASPR
jgi:hypothetical protein